MLSALVLPSSVLLTLWPEDGSGVPPVPSAWAPAPVPLAGASSPAPAPVPLAGVSAASPVPSALMSARSVLLTLWPEGGSGVPPVLLAGVSAASPVLSALVSARSVLSTPWPERESGVPPVLLAWLCSGHRCVILDQRERDDRASPMVLCSRLFYGCSCRFHLSGDNSRDRLTL